MTSNLFAKTGSDEIYNAIREEINPRCKRAKVFIESLWRKVNPFLDSDFSSKLLGITEKQSPACSKRYRRRGDLYARINIGSSYDFCIATNYQMTYCFTSSD